MCISQDGAITNSMLTFMKYVQIASNVCCWRRCAAGLDFPAVQAQILSGQKYILTLGAGLAFKQAIARLSSGAHKTLPWGAWGQVHDL